MFKRVIEIKVLGAAALVAAAFAVLPAAAGARPAANAVSPLPGGSYAGDTGHGKRLSIDVSTEGPHGSLRGSLRLGCAGVGASFATRDGTFVARHKSKAGNVTFKATGRFGSVKKVTGRIVKVNGDGNCSATGFTAKLSSPTGVHEKTIRYGPFDVDPMSGPMDTMTFTKGNIEKPCSNCSLVAMVPDLVYENGDLANMNTDAMLHHFVLFNHGAGDVSCPGWPERFFASGNERTAFVMPTGYGYPVSSTGSWSILADLMNMGMDMQTFEVQVTYYYVNSSAPVTAVKPLWLDVNNCGNSEYSIPAGRSDTPWDYQVPASIAGRIVSIGGHQHSDGVKITATDTTTGRTICTSRAGYGTNMAYMDSIDAMSGCTGNPVGRIHTGDNLRLDSVYESPSAQDGVMGIMLAYVAPTG